MCLKENYSDSPSNEFSRHYSTESESEYLRRQNMNSKLGEEQKKKGRHVRRSPKFDSNSDKKQKKGQNDNGVTLGRGLINTRNRPRNASLLGREMPHYSAKKCLITRPRNASLLGREMPHYSAEYSDSTRHIPISHNSAILPCLGLSIHVEET